MPDVRPTEVRPQELRKDAARNRQQIVETARRAFAADGLGVAMDAIGRGGGVGPAALARRSRCRDVLVEACMADRMEAYLVAAESALADPDPWEAFVSYLTATCAMQAADRGVNDLLTRSFPSSRRLERPRRRAYEAVREVMARGPV